MTTNDSESFRYLRGVRFNPDEGPMHDFVFAGFYIEAYIAFIIRGDDVRVVNNVAWRGDRYGAIEVEYGDGVAILGNTVYDCCPANKLYHAIYISKPSTNLLIAHNTIHDIGMNDTSFSVR